MATTTYTIHSFLINYSPLIIHSSVCRSFAAQILPAKNSGRYDHLPVDLTLAQQLIL
jgi:hypothetical protein